MIIRGYKPGDEIPITELFLIASPRHLRTLKYWKWSNLESPYGKSLSLVVEEEGRIIAHYSVMPWEIKVGDSVVKAGFAQQAVVYPNYRNLKIIMDLTEKVWAEATNRFDFIFGFPNNNFWKVNQMLMGWEKVDEFLADVLYSDNISNTLEQDICKKFIVKRVYQFNNSIDSWVNKNKKNELYPLKNAKLLNWRFFWHPLNYYFVFGIYYNNSLVGYMANKIYYRNNETIGHFIDYEVKDNNKDFLLTLIKASILFFKESRINKIIFWNRQVEYMDVFKNLGVERIGFKTNMGVKFLNSTTENAKEIILDISNWNLNMFLSDVF